MTSSSVVLNNHQVLIPKFCLWVWILNWLFRVGHIFFGHSTLSKVMLSIYYLFDMSFITIYIIVIFGFPIFFVSLTWNSLFLIVALITFLWTWTNHNLKCLCLFFPLIGVTPIFMSHFKSYPSLHFPRVYFNILISATFILYVYCFLTA